MTNIRTIGGKKLLYTSKGEYIGNVEEESITKYGYPYSRCYPRDTFKHPTKRMRLQAKYGQGLYSRTGLTFNRIMAKIYKQDIEFLNPTIELIKANCNRQFTDEGYVAVAAYIYDRSFNVFRTYRFIPYHIHRMANGIRPDTLVRWEKAVSMVRQWRNETQWEEVVDKK